MPNSYFHIHVGWLSKGYNSGDWEYDLTREQVHSFIVNPFLEGKRFHVNGNVIIPATVVLLRVYETEKDSKSLRKPNTNYSGEVIEESGKDVTREFITGNVISSDSETKFNLDQVFIVHGHDKIAEVELARMIEKDLGLQAVILHEQPNGGKTLVEKLERHASTPGYAFILLTPDDLGCEKTSGEPKLRTRARQNVILELGYFLGKIGRQRVCCLYTGDVEIPSDIVGVLYLPFVRSVKECLPEIAKELRNAGYAISL